MHPVFPHRALVTNTPIASTTKRSRMPNEMTAATATTTPSIVSTTDPNRPDRQPSAAPTAATRNAATAIPTPYNGM